MRKMVFGRKLSRSQKSRRALLRSLVFAIVANDKIETTKAKAKAVLPMVDKLINIAKKDTVAARRNVLAKLGNHKVTADRIFSVISPSFTKKNSGYLRLVPLNSRLGDSSQMVRLEWTETLVTPKKVETKKPVKKLAKKIETKKVVTSKKSVKKTTK